MKLNLPNKLTLIRILTIPVFMFFVVVPLSWADWVWRVIATVLFLLISFTDMLDGKIARARGLVTDFGKFLDPLADKMLVFGALLAITMRVALDAMPMHRFDSALNADQIFAIVFTCASFVIIFREMAVTSLRLVVSKSSGVVVAAAWAGKLKTVSQMACVAVVLLEPAICAWIGWRMRYVGSYTLLAVATVLTVYSGYGYFKSYWSVLRESQ